MKKSMVQKLTEEYGGSWVYIHARGVWISSTRRIALGPKNNVYVSEEGKYAPTK